MLILAVVVSCQPNAKEKDSMKTGDISSEKTRTTDTGQTATNKVVKPTVNETFRHHIPKQTYQVKADKKTSITTVHGMKVEIPENSLIDENGNPIKGDVTLEIEEYYTPGEIILSGIPMVYEENGETHAFESDGMFTITATQNDKKVSVAPQKKITCTTKRKKSGEGFEFYELKNDAWSKDAENQVSVINTNSGSKKNVLTKPVAPATLNPVKFNPNFYTVEYDKRFTNVNQHTEKTGDFITQITIDVDKNPWIKDKSKWRFHKYKSKILKKVEGEKGVYDTIPFSTVTAVRGERKYKKLLKEIEEYNENLKAFYEQQVASGEMTIADASQQLVVSRFGTYNIDRYYAQPQELIVEKKYNVKIPAEYASFERVFLMVKTQGGQLVPVDLQMYPQILRFNKTESNAIIAMQGNKVFEMKNNKFTSTVDEQKKDDQFQLALNEVEFKDVKQFDEILSQLF